MPRTQSRHGTTLIELIVSLALLVIVSGIGAIAASRTLTTQARAAMLDSRASAISDALRTLARHAGDAEPARNDIRAARDSVMDIVHPIGITSVCRSNADTIITAASADSIPWSATLPRAITTDDDLRIWHDAQQSWIQRSVRSVTSATGACGDSTTAFPGRAWQRVVLTDTSSAIRIGAVVRVLQRERWSLTRGGDGAWALSMATWDASRATFNIPQPLVAPLAAPTAAGGPGFAVRAINSAGAIVADSALATTRSLIAVLRAPRHALYGTVTDSVRINVGTH